MSVTNANAYAQQVDLNIDHRRLVELTDTAAAVGVVNEPLVKQLLEEGRARIDALLQGTYVMPISGAVPDILRVWNAAITKHLLYQHRETLEIPKSVSDDFKMAMDALMAIASGASSAIVLPIARHQGASEPGPSGGALEDVERVFGRGRDRLG